MEISTAIDRFLDNCAFTNRLSPHTIRAYGSDLNAFRRYSRIKTPSDIDKESIAAYLNHLTKDRRLKPTTVRRHSASLRVFCRWLAQNQLVEEDLVRALNFRIRLPRRLPRSLTTEHLQKILSVAQEHAFGATPNDNTLISFASLTALVSVELMFATGIRVGELAAIRLDDLDIASRILRIQGKGCRERLVFLPTAKLADLLSRYKKVRNLKANSTGAFLINLRGRPVSAQHIRTLVRTLGEKAGIPQRVTPHMFRHTAATQLLENGVDIRVIQRLLGHQSITTTQIYTHVSNSHLRLEVERAHESIGLV